MQNAEKYAVIRKWIDPQERVTADFTDAKNLNAMVIDCTPDHVDLSIQTDVPHLKQHISVPLSQVEVGEDRTRYTRDPERPLQYSRLQLSINMKRPGWV